MWFPYEPSTTSGPTSPTPTSANSDKPQWHHPPLPAVGSLDDPRNQNHTTPNKPVDPSLISLPKIQIYPHEKARDSQGCFSHFKTPNPPSLGQRPKVQNLLTRLSIERFTERTALRKVCSFERSKNKHHIVRWYKKRHQLFHCTLTFYVIPLYTFCSIFDHLLLITFPNTHKINK